MSRLLIESRNKCIDNLNHPHKNPPILTNTAEISPNSTNRTVLFTLTRTHGHPEDSHERSPFLPRIIIMRIRRRSGTAPPPNLAVTSDCLAPFTWGIFWLGHCLLTGWQCSQFWFGSSKGPRRCVWFAQTQTFEQNLNKNRCSQWKSAPRSLGFPFVLVALHTGIISNMQ